MTPRELQHLLQTNVTIGILDAFDAVGIGETAGRAAQKRGELPFHVIKIGKCLRVPTADLAALLRPAWALNVPLDDSDGVEL